MSTKSLRKPRLLALAILAVVFASATYGFAAQNTVPTTKAGDGSGVISGYTVSAVKYNLNAANPGNVDSVAFDLAGGAKPSTVKAKLKASGGSWYDCTSASLTAPYRYTCATTTPAVATVDADELRVVAAE